MLLEGNNYVPWRDINHKHVTFSDIRCLRIMIASKYHNCPLERILYFVTVMKQLIQNSHYNQMNIEKRKIPSEKSLRPLLMILY